MGIRRADVATSQIPVRLLWVFKQMLRGLPPVQPAVELLGGLAYWSDSRIVMLEVWEIGLQIGLQVGLQICGVACESWALLCYTCMCTIECTVLSIAAACSSVRAG